MNTAPHKHQINLSETETTVYISYGDTSGSVSKWFHRFPSQRRLTRAAQKVIQKHDFGSQRVQLIDQAQAQIRNELRSDWYMDSGQRMEDLHKEAIAEDRRRNNKTWTVDFSVDTGDIKGGPALAFMDEMRNFKTQGQRLLLDGGS
jgi:hypothetical protein